MGEGSAHSEHYFATAYLAKVEGSAHSGCCFATGRGAARIGSVTFRRITRDGRGQRVFGALLCHGTFGVLLGDGTQMKGEAY